MYMLLNNNHQIMLSIIQTLNKPQLKNHLLEEIALSNNVSIKTTLKYLSDLEKEYPHFINYDSNTRTANVKFYSLRIENEILRSYLKESTAVSILLDIAFNPYKTNDQRCLEFWISPSTYKRVCSKIRIFLEMYDLHLERIDSRLTITAYSEIYASKFISCLYLEVYSLKYPDRLNIYPGLKDLIASCIIESGYIVDEIALIFSFTFALVYIRRSIQDNLYHIRPNLNPNITDLIDNYASKNQISAIETAIITKSVEMILLNNDISDVSIGNFDNKAFEEMMQFSFEGMLEDKEIEFMFLIFKMLFNSYSRSPYKTSIYINRVNDFAKNLRLTHNNLYQKFTNAILDYTSNSIISEFLINDFIFWTLTNIPRLINLSRRKHSILLYSDLGNSHADFLETLFKSKLYFIDSFEIIKINQDQINEVNIKDFDLVLTTCTNLISENSMIIDDFPNFSQIIIINQRILEIIGNC